MTWDRIAAAAFTALCSIIAWTWSLSSNYGTLPQRVAAVEEQQKAATAERQDLRDAVFKIEGQLDFIVDYVKRGRK